MASSININGLSISYDGDRLIIGGMKEGKAKQDIKIDKDGKILGDVNGNISVIAKGVTIIIQGDVTGNITGAEKVSVSGDVTGNISSGGFSK